MKSGKIKVVFLAQLFLFFFFFGGGSLNCSEISDCWLVWEMERNYCRSVSTNGWLVGNSVMTECAQVGCNRVLNEWCRPHTHPPECRCRLQQLPSGRLIHWDHVFSTCGTKKRAMNTKKHDWKFVAMMIHLSPPHPFKCGHDSLSSLKAKEWSQVLNCWVSWCCWMELSLWFWQSLPLPSCHPVWAMYATLRSMPVSTLPGVSSPSSHLCERSQTGTDG